MATKTYNCKSQEEAIELKNRIWKHIDKTGETGFAQAQHAADDKWIVIAQGNLKDFVR